MRRLNGLNLLAIAVLALRLHAATDTNSPELALSGTEHANQAPEIHINAQINDLISTWNRLTDARKKTELTRLSADMILQGREAVPSLIVLMKNDDGNSGLSKVFFAHVLAEIGDIRATPAIFQAFIESQEFEEKVEFLGALERLRDPSSIALLLPHLDCGTDGADILTRQKVADHVGKTLQALANQGNGADIVVKECTRMLDTASDVEKIRMSQVLHAAASRSAEDLLLTLLYEKSSIVRCAAMVALSQTRSQNKAPGTILNLLRKADNNERKEACLALGRLKYLPSIPTLIDLINDPDHGVASNALWAIQNISNRKYGADVSVWKDWWDTERVESQKRLKILTEKMSVAAPEELPVLVEELGELPLMRREVVETVTPLLKHAEFTVRAAASNVLGRMVDPKSVPALIEQLQDTHPEVSYTAWRSLKDLTGKKYSVNYGEWVNWYSNTH